MLLRTRTRIVEKPWGRTDVPAAFGDFEGRRVGEIWFEDPAGADAPLMVKFLFTSERLSIQVHPDDATAQRVGYPRGKEECWLILSADPDAELGVGLKAKSDAETLRRAARDGSIEDMIDWRHAEVGDFVYNSAGTIHAIGPGLVLVEVQQNVDCTYRLYDYGRPRELHLDAGLAVAMPEPHNDPRDTRVDKSDNRELVGGPHFHLLHLSGSGADALLPREKSRFSFVPLSAGCTAAGEEIRLGECVILEDAQTIALAPDARALLCWPT
ncbi:class I mannose-6-phosphate isomerase [Sphingopyxis panaciterrulae]|uniref:Mannose-6-phosphate isomerase n=1 Tax=Sphingopyxis panaciterrulae TaxID=462372 RepID=A0A7W9B7F9_9SPHN|nr:class I mannose-6-phosphate isomerase [Sphingopyxis panaciterrulae]MBB5707612.1 mannose-6-phosphate isomerase [Sphingopyxis panaciterrulae]